MPIFGKPVNKEIIMAERFLFTSEQVSDGHPDKICDYISDSILDAALEQDPNSQVACETMIKNNTVIVAGEISTKAILNYENIVRKSMTEIGYNDETCGMDPRTTNIIFLMNTNGGRKGNANEDSIEVKAFDHALLDQGIVMGYATNETPEMLPMTIVLATKLLLELKKVRKSKQITWLRPDAKSQVTIEYELNNTNQLIPLRIDTVLLSTQHDKGVTLEEIQKIIKEQVIDKVLPANLVDKQTKFFINPSGSFVVGGPKGDAGVTGRKQIADTYGGWGAHGGGSFSGKDPSKIERSGSYLARWIAKSLVTNGFCSRCLVQLSYGSGVSEPMSLHIDTFGTASNGLKNSDLIKIVQQNFNLNRESIVQQLDLRRPIYKESCLFNHFMGHLKTHWEVPKSFS